MSLFVIEARSFFAGIAVALAVWAFVEAVRIARSR